ncbi:hypothetical protein LEN26_018309, partial [Aphanomyces euteiches]
MVLTALFAIMSTAKPPSKSANWNDVLDSEFLRFYADVASRVEFVASGGKQLKSKGWHEILVRMQGKGNIIKSTQLQSRWKRMKEDYIDYRWLLLKFSGDGLVGLSNDAWKELDEHPRAHPISRFRDRPFIHYNTMAEIVGDVMATGEFLRGMPSHDSLSEDPPTTSEGAISNIQTVTNVNDLCSESDTLISLTAAQKRKNLVNESMKR